MSRANLALLVMMLTTLGLWGCAQRASQGAGSARLRDLESRHAKLEEDYRAAVAARDRALKKAAAAEAQAAQHLEQAQAAVKERDELRQQLATRSQERDAFQAQLSQLGKELQNLVGRIETAVNGNIGPPLTAAVVPETDKS